MTSISNYRILRSLGEGSFAKVKMGIHRKTNQRVAIKIIKPSVSDKQKLSKIKQEAKILSSFNHPHILRVYEFIQSEEGLFIVMEYLPGGELYDLIINKGKFSEEDSRLIFQQLICALDYCHHHGVAHRDIKPENILLDEQNNIKLGDFGLSNYFHDGAFLNTKCGSLNYAAPELLEGKKYCGPEIDVWSSGVVLYVLVTGCLPFDENQVATLTLKIKNADYSVPLSVSLICKDLISRMLNPDPLHRITVGQIRHHPWFNTKLPNHLNFGVNCLDKDEVFSLCEIKPRSSLKLDQEIFNKCTQLHLCPDYSEDRLKRRLSKQKQDAFCVAYRMLQDQKQKEKIKELNQKSLEITPAFTSPDKKKKSPKSKTRSSISKIQNSSKPQSTVFKFQDFEVHQLFSPHNWTYGFRALKSTQDFYSLFMKSCEELQMKVIVSPDLKLKVKGREVSVLCEFFKVKDQQVDNAVSLDFVLKKGKVMNFLNICSELYTSMKKYS